MKVKTYHTRVLIAWLAGAVLAGGLMALVGTKPAWTASRTFEPALNSPLSVGSAPTTVTSADFNADGKMDLAAQNSGSNTVSVRLGNGEGTFQTKQDFAVGVGPTSVISADFNGDGIADLAVANQNSGNVSILLGQDSNIDGKGDGTFLPKKDYAVGPLPSSVISADFNTDGITDLALATRATSEESAAGKSDQVSVLLGQDSNGDGKGDDFRTAQRFSIAPDCTSLPCLVLPMALPNQIIAADFNGDNKADLATANVGLRDPVFETFNNPGGVSVLLGKGDGTFQAPKGVMREAPDEVFSITAANLDAGSSMDLVATKFNSNSISVLKGNGDGTFQAPQSLGVGVNPSAVTSADLDGDTKADDLAVSNYSSNNVSVLFNNDNGSFQAAQNFAAGSGPVFVVGANFNTDSFTDLAVANQNSNNVSVLLNTPRADTTAPITTRSLSPQSNAAGWNKEDVTITLNATDDDSGVKEISYSINGGQLTTVQQSSVQIPVTNEGTTTISYHSTDNANNAEPQQTFAVKIDKTKPSVGSVSAVTGTAPNFTGATNYTAGDLTNKDVRVSWTCADNTGGSGPVNASESRTFTSSGSVTPSCTDQAGNTASGSAFAVNIDKTKPMVSTATPTGTGVARSTNATAAFSEKMNPLTITKSTFKLFRCSSTTSTNCATQITNVGVSLSPDRLTATLNPFPTNPTSLLVSRTKFKVVLTTGAKDEAGNPLDQAATTGNQQKVWYFTTGT